MIGAVALPVAWLAVWKGLHAADRERGAEAHYGRRERRDSQ